jgi:NDP-sugar pyrophosphorylase family protein
MKAVLLSAGLGKRLKSITDNIPKVMVPVNGKPCLEYNIENLKRQGVSEFLINTHYLPEKIKEYFGDGSKFGVKISYSYEPMILGTAGALNNFKEELNDTFLVIYGDVISDIDILNALDIHKKNKAEATIILDKKRTLEGKGIVLREREEVIEFVEKPDKEIKNGLINSGVYILEPSILNIIKDGFSDFGKDILPSLAKEGKVFCEEHEGYIFDIGTEKDLIKTEDFFNGLEE